MAEIPLTQGKVALVDDADYEGLRQHKWCVHVFHGMPYAERRVGPGKTVLMHRAILNAPDGSIVDHRDGNTLNNTRSNLRIATRQENNRNVRRTDGVSRYKGVGWEKSAGKWRARIQVDGKRIHLGLFATENDAACAYNVAAKQHFGEFAVLNDPLDATRDRAAAAE